MKFHDLFALYFTLLLLGQGLLSAQQVKYIRLPDNPDSSFYDIFRLNENQYWLAGENGVLYEMDEEGKMKRVSYPGTGKDLLKMDTLSDGTRALIGEEGSIYFYNPSEKSWRHEKVPGYDRKVFYEMAIGANDEIVICGGNSKIAASKARMPFGFVIRSLDKGRHWQRIYHHPFAMVWDVDFIEGQLHVLIYNPLSRKKLLILDDNGKWKGIKRSRYLFHQLDEESLILSGGTVMRRNANSSVESISGDFSHDGHLQFVWSARKRGGILTAISSNGLIYRWSGGDTEIIETGGVNLYEMAEAPDGDYFIVGSSGIVLRMSENQSQAKENN